MKTGIELIAEERKRQIESEGWDLNHDKKHDSQELARVAAIYATPESYRRYGNYHPDQWLWPANWDSKWFKPTANNRIRELQKAGALIAAEIDRLQQQENKNPKKSDRPTKKECFQFTQWVIDNYRKLPNNTYLLHGQKITTTTEALHIDELYEIWSQ